MDESEIISFARSNLEQIPAVHRGTAYRCAATLKDGLHLPCVLLAGLESYVELALRRFDETRSDGGLPQAKRRFGYPMQYADIVETFVANGNRLNHYDIARLEQSRYAIPFARLQEVKGETGMSWTQFSALMRDGREFAFATTYLTEFFHMPDGYSGSDIVSIIPHKAGTPVHRERPFFTCHVHGL